MKSIVAVLLYIVLLSGIGIARAQDPWAASASRVVSPTVAVRITWMDKTGNQKVSRGTAFLISREGYYITAAHIIPSGVNPDDLLIEAESRPFLQRRLGPVTMTLIGTPDRSNLVDFAVLRDASVSIKATPLLYNPRIPAPPEELLIFGYAGESGSETNINRVAGEGDNESIKMHAFVKEGFSGSPVVDTYGSVIGMVRGGDPVAEIKSDAGVMGKALFVPISRIVNKVKNIAGVEWAEATVETEYKNTSICVNFNCNIVSLPTGSKPTGVLAKLLRDPVTKHAIKHTRSIDVTKDDHPILLEPNVEKYPPIVIKAFEGFKITGAAFTTYSANGAEHSVDVTNDGRSASLHYSLTSGPWIDRYRGWIKGDFVITMVPK